MGEQMRWYEATVHELVRTGTDATRNPIFELRETNKVVLVRHAPMEAVHNDTEGNQFDVIERTFLTKSRKELLEGAAALSIDGDLYDIVRVSEWGDPVAVRVKRCKP